MTETPTEKPKMPLSQFREHCQKVQALPIVHLIDRISYLTAMGEKALGQIACICIDEKSKYCLACDIRTSLDRYGYEAPIE